MKAFIGTDLEGASGIISFEDQCSRNGRYYEEAKKMLTSEVNAAIEGLLDAGVGKITVSDGHGCGAISLNDLNPEAELLHGSPRGKSWIHRVKEYDFSLMIGQHAMSGIEERACLHHTQSHIAIEYYKLNGKMIGEIAQFALNCGAVDVPLIFLSGDLWACREAEDLIPGITTVPVKEGVSRTAAISYHPKRNAKAIREGVAEAVKKHLKKPVAPLKWQGPFTLEKKYLSYEYAQHSSGEKTSPTTVQLRSKNILDIIYA
ncbi:MAG: M55 family metallopeptidase [Verrucomicrobiota bacterium]